jgi:hypothetical protein
MVIPDGYSNEIAANTKDRRFSRDFRRGSAGGRHAITTGISNNHTESALSEVSSIALILILVVLMAGITGAYLFGLVQPVAKTGYLVPKAEIVNASGAQLIWLQHGGGDVFTINTSDKKSGDYQLGMVIETNTTSTRVVMAPSVSSERFAPGNRVVIYRSGTGYLATDNLTSPPSASALPSGPFYLVLTDETSHVLLAKILLNTGVSINDTTPTPTPATTPVPISNVYLNAVKGAGLQSGGSLQFQVTGSWSSVSIGGTTYSLSSGDTVKLVTGSDGYGNLYGTSSQISTFSFDDVTLYVNGVYRGRGTISNIWISGYSDQVSTLSLKMPAATAWTDFRVDGMSVIYGVNSTPVTITGLKAPMNMASASGSIYYDGAASGYSLA